MEKTLNKDSNALIKTPVVDAPVVDAPVVSPARTLFTSPLLSGDELLPWIERNGEKIERILREEVTQDETEFE